MKRLALKTLSIVLTLILTAAAYKAGLFFVERMVYWRELAGIMDWQIFIDYAQRYITTGSLYEQDLALYGPGAPIYKFPPFFISLIILCLQQGVSAESLWFWNYMLHIFLYFVTAAVLLVGVKRQGPFWFYPLAALFLLSSETFFDNYVRLQLEIYIVFLLSLAMVFLIHKRHISSGFCLGLAAGLKIYPVFFSLIYVVRRDYRALAGVVLGIVASVAVSLTMINGSEHWHYFVDIVPHMLNEVIYGTAENISISYFAFLLGVSHNTALMTAKWTMYLSALVIVTGTIYSDFYKNKTNDRRDMGKQNDVDALKIAAAFSVLISGFVLGAVNSWWNYQLLLIIPVISGLAIACDRSHWSVVSVLVLFVSALLVYCGAVDRLASMNELIISKLGNPNFLQPLFVHSVYLRAMASILVYLTSLYLYWRVVRA